MGIMRFILFLFAFLVAASYSVGAENPFSFMGNLQQPAAPSSAISLQGYSIPGPVDSTYRIGPSDVFQLSIEGNIVDLQVTPESSVAIDKVGVISLKGLTLGEAKEKILQELSAYYDAERCFVHLIQLKHSRMSLYGAVKYPGQYAITPGMRLSWVLRMAGGTMSGGDEENVMLIRKGDTTVFNLQRGEMLGDQSQDPIVEQGDLAIVPDIQDKGPVIYVRTKDDVRPLLWYKDKSLSGYLRSALILRDVNDYKEVFLTRRKGEIPKKVPLFEADNIFPEPGTLIEVVPVKFFVYVGGATLSSGPVRYHPAYHAVDYVASSGLTPLSGDVDRLTVIRADGSRTSVDPSADPIYPGDTILLPKSRYETVKDFTIFLGTLMGIAATVLTITITLRQN